MLIGVYLGASDRRKPMVVVLSANGGWVFEGMRPGIMLGVTGLRDVSQHNEGLCSPKANGIGFFW
jgi:hypothetical protein